MKDITQLLKLFEQYARNIDYATAFSELLDVFLLSMKWYDTAQEQELALEQIRRLPRKNEYIAFMTEVGEQAENFGDPLGELYQQLLSKGRHGQFFTPEHVSGLMAELAGLNEMRNGQTVIDPACGSGRMLLAAAKRNRDLRFYGADIGPVCCKMAVTNLLLNSLTGEIAHMDTLSNEFYRGYQTGTFLQDGYHYPFYREFTNPQESAIWLRPVSRSTPQKFETPFEPSKSPLMSQGVQGNLFEQ